MNAAKKIRKLIESGAAEGDVAVLVDLARSLETGVPFQLSQLNALDMRNFDLAMELIADWRFDHHIPARRKLTDVIMNLHEESAAESVDLAPMAKRQAGSQSDLATYERRASRVCAGGQSAQAYNG